MFDKAALMKLRTPGKNGCNERNPKTASKVSQQIVEQKKGRFYLNDK